MKAVILIISLFLHTSSAFASGTSTVEKFLPNIRDRVRNCSVLVYQTQDGVRRDQALKSHCPEVKVLPVQNRKAQAKINVAGHQFVATLIETDFSDGDFYDVEIRDLSSQETFRIYNTAAYGDVLLGVLDGNLKGVISSEMIQ